MLILPRVDSLSISNFLIFSLPILLFHFSIYAASAEITDQSQDPFSTRVTIIAKDCQAAVNAVAEIANKIPIPCTVEYEGKAICNKSIKIFNQPLSSAINYICRCYGLRYELDKSGIKIELDRPFTKEYYVPVISHNRDVKLQSNIDRQLGSNSVTSSLMINPWQEIENSISKIVGNKDAVVVNKSCCIVSVLATREQHRSVETYVAAITKLMSINIDIELIVLEVKISDKEAKGIDWNNFSIQSVISRKSGAFDLALKDYKLMISALEKYGQVSTLSHTRISAINNQPAIVQLLKSNSGNLGNTNDTILMLHPVINQSDKTITFIVKPTISRSNPSEKDSKMTRGLIDSIIKVTPYTYKVLCGIASESIKRNKKSLPWISQVPIIGNLFRYSAKADVKKEMVILISAKAKF